MIRLPVLLATIALLIGVLAALAAAPPAPAPARKVTPPIVLSGADSALAKPEAVRARAQDQWQALWTRHAATLPKLPTGMEMAVQPEVDFERWMVVGIFGGSMTNCNGAKILGCEETATELVISMDWRFYSSAGVADYGTPYALVVLPRSDKAIVIRTDQRSKLERAARAPAKWHVLHQIAAVERAEAGNK